MKTSMIAHVNLVPRAMQEAHLRARYITRWAIGVMAVLTLVGLPGLYIGGNAVLSDPAVGVQIEQVHVQVKSNRDAIPKLQQELVVLRAEQQVLDLVRNRIDWHQVFAELVSASEGQVRFTGLSAMGGGVDGSGTIEVQIEGIAATQTGVRSFVVSIESLRLFDRIELGRTSRMDIGDDEVISFQIKAEVGAQNITGAP